MNSVKSEYIAKLLAEKAAEAQTIGNTGNCHVTACRRICS